MAEMNDIAPERHSITLERHAREFEIELPIGYLDADGSLHRTAALRKMTGRDEAIMADKNNRNNAARMVTELLANCLVRLGDIEKPGRPIVQQLYSGDRYFLLMKLREITFGPDMQASYSCPTCREANGLIEDLAALDVIRLADGELLEDIVVVLDDGYDDRNGQHYDTLVFRYPTGADEEKIASAVRENASAGKNALMARCLKSCGDMPKNRMEGLGTAIFNDLTLGDRARIDRALNEQGPGIRLSRELDCVNCGRHFNATLDLSNFLSAS